MKVRLSARAWLSVITLVLLGLLLIGAWEEIVHAWELVGSVNLWILSLFIPLVLLNYFAASEIFVSYLRQKGLLGKIKAVQQMRLSLEFNFVNHALPSGGASGMSYATWRLSKLGVPASKATMAQVVRVAVSFMAFFVLLLLAVVIITIDGGVNRWIILVSATLSSLMTITALTGWYLISKNSRMHRAALWLERVINGATRRLTRGRKRVLVHSETIEAYMQEIHEDYLELKREKHRLVRPLIWAVIFLLTDVAMFCVAFWALGHIVNPAPVLIAYGLATLAGFAVLTPGGSGAYEALMASFLAIAGVVGGVAIAGVLLTRVIVLLVILVPGYMLYQEAIIRYGKPRTTAER